MAGPSRFQASEIGDFLPLEPFGDAGVVEGTAELRLRDVTR